MADTENRRTSKEELPRQKVLPLAPCWSCSAKASLLQATVTPQITQLFRVKALDQNVGCAEQMLAQVDIWLSKW